MTEYPVEWSQTGETWWCRYQDYATLWARGDSQAKAETNLRTLAPRPWEVADEDAAVVTYERGGHGFAGDAYDAELRVVATGEDAALAEANILTHVPIPHSNGGHPTDRPPKLEDKPLPPV